MIHLHNFSKIKSHKEVTKQLKSRFFLLFLLDDRRIRIRIRICTLTNGSGSKLPDPTDQIRSTAFSGRMALLVTLFLVLVNIFNSVTANAPKVLTEDFSCHPQ